MTSKKITVVLAVQTNGEHLWAMMAKLIKIMSLSGLPNQSLGKSMTIETMASISLPFSILY